MQVAALFREADLFVGCDSGPAHLAAAARVPSVVLFSGTNNSECWRPVGPFVRVLRHPVPCAPCHQRCCPIAGHPCMSGISVPQVLQAARDMIDDSRALREEVAISAPNQVHRSPTRKRGD
jgi:ADP-heptose:LPS heptosyltransferase